MVGCVSGSKTQFITSRLNYNTKIIKERVKYKCSMILQA